MVGVMVNLIQETMFMHNKKCVYAKLQISVEYDDGACVCVYTYVTLFIHEYEKKNFYKIFSNTFL